MKNGKAIFRHFFHTWKSSPCHNPSATMAISTRQAAMHDANRGVAATCPPCGIRARHSSPNGLSACLENGRDRPPTRSGEWIANETEHETLGNPAMGRHSLTILADRPVSGRSLPSSIFRTGSGLGSIRCEDDHPARSAMDSTITSAEDFFKRETGVPPTAYRQAHQQSPSVPSRTPPGTPHRPP